MKKRLSEAQEGLIECLKFLKVSTDAIVMTMLLIKDDAQIAEMADYLLTNPGACESDILKTATVISERRSIDE